MSEKLYFKPGDTVFVRQLPNTPIMTVKSIEKKATPLESEPKSVVGVLCFWFTKDLGYQEQVFNFKDLELHAALHSSQQ
jgi:hypothetical protein